MTLSDEMSWTLFPASNAWPLSVSISVGHKIKVCCRSLCWTKLSCQASPQNNACQMLQ